MKGIVLLAFFIASFFFCVQSVLAEENPFAEVPKGHASYALLEKLAEDGFISGFSKESFRNDTILTRYEMAQLVGRASVNLEKMQGEDRVALDQLMTEYKTELKNLGVRIAELEKHADKVKWSGEIEMDFMYGNHSDEIWDPSYQVQTVLFDAKAEIAENWTVNGRLSGATDLMLDTNYGQGMRTPRLWLEGHFLDESLALRVGRFVPSDIDYICDTTYTGAEFKYDGKLQAILGIGRLGGIYLVDDEFQTADYQSLVVNFPEKGRLSGGFGIHRMTGDRIFQESREDGLDCGAREIWLVKGSWRFSDTLSLGGFLARNTKADWQENSGSIDLNYRGADASVPGSWGVWAGYHNIGYNAAIVSTYSVAWAGMKTFELGGNYVPFENILLTFRYGRGKEMGQMLREGDSVMREADTDRELFLGVAEYFF